MNFIAASYQPLVKIVLLIGLGFLATLLEYLAYRHYYPKISAKGAMWRQIVLQSMRGPLLYYIWAVTATAILNIVLQQLGLVDDIFKVVNPATQILATFFILWFFMRLIGHWERYSVANHEAGHKKIFRDATSIHAVAQVLRVAALLILVMMMLSAVGLPISTLLTFGGIGGLAISFAARDTLANFLGGLMVYWDRPFAVGDWIRSPDRNIEGTVVNIGWRLTKITTFDKRPLYVPNGVFSTISVENPSRMLNRRIKTLIGIRYEDATKVSAIVQDITNMLKSHPDIDADQTCFVNLVEFGESGLNLLIYTFTKTTNWVEFQAVQERIFLKLIDIVSGHGAEFAYPTQTVHMPDVSLQHISTKNIK